MTFPSFDHFQETYQKGKSQWVYLDCVADIETPVSAYLKLSDKQKYSFLLESVEGGISKSRYSFIGIDPDLVWRCREKQSQCEIFHKKKIEPDYQKCSKPPLETLRDLWKSSYIEQQSAPLPPMSAGLFGYMGYDMIRLVENLGQIPKDSLGLDDAVFIRPRLVVVFDNLLDKMILVTPVWKSAYLRNARACWDEACAYLKKAKKILEGSLPDDTDHHLSHSETSHEVSSNMSAEEYQRKVEQAQNYIREGDIYQLVLSQRFSVKLNDKPFDFYRRLRRINPSPYLFFLRLADLAIAGSSPEILVRVREGKVNIRPIAGTRKRGRNSAEDERLAKDLLQDPKECAEHLMLLDLARHDAGRVAVKGSVTVKEKFVIERYSHVMHIASQIDALLAEDKDGLDALLAGFPAGTLSGAPKIRAMQLIDALEPEKRGIYGGCIGYLGSNGELDSCIALRTAVIKEGTAYIQAGAGIVADSIPEKEHEECLNKAQALLKSV